VKRLVTLVSVSVSVLAALAGCGRHVVVEPETAARANDRAWVVKSEPGQSGLASDGGTPP
jgi:hypothetical protein